LLKTEHINEIDAP